MQVPNLEEMVAAVEAETVVVSDEEIPRDYLKLLKGEFESCDRDLRIDLKTLEGFCRFYGRKLGSDYPMYQRILDHYNWPLIDVEGKQCLRLNELLIVLEHMRQDSFVQQKKKADEQQDRRSIIANGTHIYKLSYANETHTYKLTHTLKIP